MDAWFCSVNLGPCHASLPVDVLIDKVNDALRVRSSDPCLLVAMPYGNPSCFAKWGDVARIYRGESGAPCWLIYPEQDDAGHLRQSVMCRSLQSVIHDVVSS